MDYKLKKISNSQAHDIITRLVRELEGIDETDLTTFEKNLLCKCVENPPRGRGAEEAILDAYTEQECPDCGEPIPEDASRGSECSNCHHVFWAERESDEHHDIGGEG